MLAVPSCQIAWLKVAFNASFESCELERERLNGEANEEEVPRDDDVLDTDSLELYLQRDTAWPQKISAVDSLVMSV